MTAQSQSWSDACAAAWNQFWFTAADSRPLAAVRITTAIGLLIYLAAWGDIAAWLAADGYLPARSSAAIALENDGNSIVFRGGLLPGIDSGLALQVYRGLMFAAAGCLAIGLFTRIAAVATWLLVLLFVHRFGFVAGPCEQLLTTLLFYVAINPAAEVWSLDARRGTRTAEPTLFANIVLRMLQVHIAALVFTMAETKLAGPAWWDGDAVWYLMARTLSRPSDLAFLRRHEFFLNAWTHGIVLAELAFPILVWNRLTRPVVIAAVAIAWLTLPILTGEWLLPVFSAAALLAFIPAEWYTPSEVAQR